MKAHPGDGVSGYPVPGHPSNPAWRVGAYAAPFSAGQPARQSDTAVVEAAEPLHLTTDELIEPAPPFPTRLRSLAAAVIEHAQASRRQVTGWVGNMAMQVMKFTIDTQTRLEHGAHAIRTRSERREAAPVYRTLEEWWNVLAYYQENLPRPYATSLTWLTVMYPDPSNGRMIVDHLHGRGTKLQRDIALFGTAHPGTQVLDIRVGGLSI